MGISDVGWEFHHTFIGQEDTVKKSSKDDFTHLFNCVKKIFVMAGVYRKMAFAGTDGCHSVRSDAVKHAGPMANGSEGKSVIAQFWLDGLKVMALQCLPHLGNSSWGKTLKTLVLDWLQMMQVGHEWALRALLQCVI